MRKASLDKMKGLKNNTGSFRSLDAFPVSRAQGGARSERRSLKTPDHRFCVGEDEDEDEDGGKRIEDVWK